MQGISIDIRKLPLPMKVANYIYQILMLALTCGNLALTVLNESDTIKLSDKYFEISTCVLSFLPLFWTKLLDTTKQHFLTVTPPPDSPK